MFVKGFLAAFLFSVTGVAAPSMPVNLKDGSSRFLSRALGPACYTMDSVQRGLPCNPAGIAKDRAPRFDGDFVIGTQASYLREAEDILRGQDRKQAVLEFFKQRESVEAEVSAEISFQAAKWGVAIEPYRLIAVTRFENPALPMIDMVIAEEQSIKGQIASYTSENFYAGLQVRYTHVRYIDQYFSLSEAVAGNNEELFAAQTQDLLYFEPGFLYAWEDVTWQPQVSAVLAHWGVTSKKTDAYAVQPQGLLGASVKPPMPLGLLEVGMQAQLQSETRNLRDALRAALSYQLGILQAVVSLSDYDRSAGFLLSYKNFSTGLSYWDENDARGVFMQLGVSL